MNDPAQVGEQLEEAAHGFLTFTGVKRPDRRDRLILIMGLTGSGKSSFVASCSGKQVKIGHSLFSCAYLPDKHQGSFVEARFVTDAVRRHGFRDHLRLL